MFSPERILDRGRILIGMLVIVPFGVLAPGVGSVTQDSGPTWAITAATPNPLDQPAATPRDVLAKLTNPTLASVSTPPDPAAKPQTDPSATTPPPTVEVGSEADDGRAPSLPGTDLATHAAGATPSATPPGPMPVATPSVAAYPAPVGATHIFPVAGGAQTSDDWGTDRAGGTPHRGIDLFAVAGSPVVAVSDGTLFRVGWNSVGGWRLWLRDTWGNEFYYAHLASYAPGMKDGAQVRAGAVLGIVGNSGDATTSPPHLHFEVHPHGGDPVPPLPFVSIWPRV